MAAYRKGQGVRLSVAFTTTAGSAADPTTVSLGVKAPGGAVSTYTYALAQVSKGGTGSYFKDLAGTVAGIYYWRWVGAGALDAVGEGEFLVMESSVI